MSPGKMLIEEVFSIMKKFLALALALVMLLGLAACGSKTEPADGSAAEAVTPSDDAFVVGICQLVQHEALDAATQGFKDALIEAFGEDGVVFDEQNAAGDPATCSTICDGFVTEGVFPRVHGSGSFNHGGRTSGASLRMKRHPLNVKFWSGQSLVPTNSGSA